LLRSEAKPVNTPLVEQARWGEVTGLRTECGLWCLCLVRAAPKRTVAVGKPRRQGRCHTFGGLPAPYFPL
jgi:hypothetical protein